MDASDRPVPGAMVTLVSPGPAIGFTGSARTQADGTFRIANVTSGRYQLTASVPVTWSADSVAGGAGVFVTGGSLQTAPRSEVAEVLVDGGHVTDVRLVVQQP